MGSHTGIIIPYNPSIIVLTPPLYGELIDPIMGVCYKRNMGFALDEDLALLVLDASVSEWGVAQTHV